MMATTTKKPAADLSALVATKGAASPTKDMPTRATAPATAADETKGSGGEPLNFRVPADFRRRFKTYAAQHDMKLNELLYKAFEAYVSR
jgi:hypothetical protein